MGMALLHGVPLGFHLGKAFYAGLAGSLHNLSELNFLLQCQQEVDPQACGHGHGCSWLARLPGGTAAACVHPTAALTLALHAGCCSLVQLHSTLRGILDAPADSVSSMCLTFRITCDRLGEAVEVALGGEWARFASSAGCPVGEMPLQHEHVAVAPFCCPFSQASLTRRSPPPTAGSTSGWPSCTC